MNKRVLAVVVALVVVIGGSVIAYATLRPSVEDAAAPAPSPVASAPVVPPTTPSPVVPEAPVVSPGAYVDYSDSAIADSAGRTVLFFHAPWCGQCRELESDILSQGVPDGITIIKVDYDSHQDLRQKYGVTMRTTFVELDASGAVSQSFVAYDTPQLTAVIDALAL